MLSMNNRQFPYSTKEVVIKVVSAYREGKGIFSNKVNAEDLVPNVSKENKALFLFWVIQMDYSIKSSSLYKKANKLYSERPEWIQTSYLQKLSEEELRTLITRLSPRYPNEIFIRLSQNSRKLLNLFNGSAWNLVTQSQCAQELLSNIRQFRGFGPKLGNFLARTYIDLFNLEYDDLNTILPPVDIHDVRLTYEWGFNNSKDMTTKNIKLVQQIWSTACTDANRSWITFDKALWLIGSEGVRSGNPLKDFKQNIGDDI
jgi:hypothetical protein